MRGFDPENDAIDKRILYEITGRKGPNERYSDDEGTDSDDENSGVTSISQSLGSEIRSSLMKRKRETITEEENNYGLN